MIYAPHTLYVSTERQPEFDDKMNPVKRDGEFTLFCRCRCDNKDVHKIQLDNERLYFSRYHIVSEKSGVKNGQLVRVVDEDGDIAAEGRVVKVGKSNYFGCSEIWL